jgi:hypothetical protein
MDHLKPKPLISSAAAGLIASVCCGGSLVFASAGLGASYGALGLSRYVPQALAAGALCIVMINYFFYRRAGERSRRARAGDILDLRKAMFSSAALGLAAMATNFVFLEWLNHAVANPYFLSRPEYGQALIPGVPNVRFLYTLASFWALALLWALPWPRLEPIGERIPSVFQRVLRVGVFTATAAVLVVVVVNAARGGAGHGGGRDTTDISASFRRAWRSLKVVQSKSKSRSRSFLLSPFVFLLCSFGLANKQRHVGSARSAIKSPLNTS